MTSQTKFPWFNSSFNLTNLPTINEKKRTRGEKKSQVKSINEDDEEAFNLNNLDSDLNTLFTNKFEPKRKFDLVVNSRKIIEVEQWFDYIFQHRPPDSQLFLFVFGPSGSGKTSTIRLIAKERDIEIREYQEVISTNNIFNWEDEIGKDLVSTSYSSLTTYETQVKSMKNFCWNVNKPSLFDTEFTNRVILIKDFPSTFLTDPDQFYNLFSIYYRYFHRSGAPVIFIVTVNSKKDQTISKFFKSKWRDCLQVREIWFNPFTKRCISQFLTNIAQLKISKEEIESIAENSEGDLRYALNNFELKHRYSLNEKPLRKKRRKTEAVKKSEFTVSRDFSLTFYHFLGKILFGKRLYNQPKDSLPSHLFSFERHPLKDDPHSLMSMYEISPDTLSLYLFQNYLEFSSNLDCIASSIDWLSFVDCLHDRENFNPELPLNIYKKFISIAGIMFDLNPNLDKPKNSFKSHSSKMVGIKGPKWFENFKKTLYNQSLINQEMDKDCNHTSSELIMDLLPYSSLMKRSFFVKKSYNNQILKTFSDFGCLQSDVDSLFTQLSNACVENDNTNDSVLDYNLNIPASNEETDEDDYIIEEV